MTIKLNDQFWDCECETNYIHPNIKFYCSNCDCFRENQPYSRADEVEAALANGMLESSSYVVVDKSNRRSHCFPEEGQQYYLLGDEPTTLPTLEQAAGRVVDAMQDYNHTPQTAIVYQLVRVPLEDYQAYI